MKFLLATFSALFVLYVGACSYVSHKRSGAFETIKTGDAEGDVIALFGSPSVREKKDALFSRYATEPCTGDCVERLWFENRMTLDTEAWSVELDSSRTVIKKTHWASP